MRISKHLVLISALALLVSFTAYLPPRARMTPQYRPGKSRNPDCISTRQEGIIPPARYDFLIYRDPSRPSTSRLATS
jgi:hypothetical protein